MRLPSLSLVRLAVGGALIVGCARAEAGDVEEFCADVAANREAIISPPATTDDIDDFLDLYRRIGETAPLAIDAEWEALTVNYETASTVEPGDPESVQRAVTQALRTERAAVAVHEYLLVNCEVDIGDVATIAASRPTTTTPPVDPGD